MKYQKLEQMRRDAESVERTVDHTDPTVQTLLLFTSYVKTLVDELKPIYDRAADD